MVIALTMGNAHLLLSILFCLVKKSVYVCVYYTDLHKVHLWLLFLARQEPLEALSRAGTMS